MTQTATDLASELARDLKGDIGYRLMTLLLVDGPDLARCFSSLPDAYPVSGRKQMRSTPWGDHVLIKGLPWLGTTRADIEWAFPDHQTILGLGCGACINLPVRNAAGEVSGTLNLLDAEGAYEPADLLRATTYEDRILSALTGFAGTH